MLSIRPQVPQFSGPYTVGTTEHEIPISEIDTQTSPPDSQDQTLKFRLFYPTNTPYHGQSIPWVPAPQRQWTEAFGRFLGASLGWSSIVNPMLSLLSYITIPAVPNAPLAPRQRPYPLVIFSHGLAGNCNTYSAFCGSMASCGMIVAAVEHRDGSCPVSMVRGADGKVVSQVDYRKYSHNPTPEVFNARNSQLRTRMRELDLLFTTLSKYNAGERFTNYASVGEKTSQPSLSSMLDLKPGRVTWAGHSFGACSITQFVKSVYYHHALPSLKGTSHEHDEDWRPLLSTRAGSELNKQITPSSPVVLLDVWTMPFRAPSTSWLWERPMPCYDVHRQTTFSRRPTTVSIMSTEFYNWTELLNRTRALLSASPLAVTDEISKQSEPRSPKTPKLEDTAAPRTPKFATPPNKHPDDDDDVAAYQETDLLPPASLPLDANVESHGPAEPIDRSASSSPSSSTTSSHHHSTESTPAESPASSTTSLSPSITAKPAPLSLPQQQAPSSSITTDHAPAALYHIPHSAHLSQSDFGPLFPTLTRLLMKAVDPFGTMQLNVRAATQTVRNAGLEEIERIDVAGFAADRALNENGKSRRSWFGWLGRTAEAETGERVVNEKKVEALRQDSILQETGLPRWKELDVPVVSAWRD